MPGHGYWQGHKKTGSHEHSGLHCSLIKEVWNNQIFQPVQLNNWGELPWLERRSTTLLSLGERAREMDELFHLIVGSDAWLPTDSSWNRSLKAMKLQEKDLIWHVRIQSVPRFPSTDGQYCGCVLVEESSRWIGSCLQSRFSMCCTVICTDAQSILFELSLVSV